VSVPSWAVHLTEDDEWTVRTALANVARDCEEAAKEATSAMAPALAEAAAKYHDVLSRIEIAGQEAARAADLGG